MGKLANSSAASPNLPTSNEDTARLAFEAGEVAFMLNYTFAFASAKENAPEIAKEMGAAPFPRVNEHEAKPPLGGFNLAVSAYSEHKQMAFEPPPASRTRNRRKPRSNSTACRPRALIGAAAHPPPTGKTDPEETEGLYEELKSNLEAAVNREGLL